MVSAIGWEKLRPTSPKPSASPVLTRWILPALTARAWPVLHCLGPILLDTFQFRAVPAAAATIRAVELLYGAYGSGRKWPKVLPTSFLRPAWRDAVLSTGSEVGVERRRT